MTYFFRNVVREANRRIRTALIARINAFLQEHISGMSVVQLFNRERKAQEQFEVRNRDHMLAYKDAILAFALFYPAVELLSVAAIAAILWFGGLRVLGGGLPVGVLFAFIQYAQRIFRPIQDLSEKFNVLQTAMASSERIFKLLDELTTARSRKQIQQYYADSIVRMGGFPERLKPVALYPAIDLKGRFTSETARFYSGGLLAHGPAVMAHTNPSTNSYRRLVPGYEAPVSALYSLGNRSAAIRIPKYANRPESARMEFRPPDATCNPYMAIAAQLMAGIDGVRRRLDPTELGFGPFEEDVFSWPAEKSARIKALPTSLEEALAALERDHEFLLEGGVFSREMLQRIVKKKRAEERAVRDRPHPYEIELYYDL